MLRFPPCIEKEAFGKKEIQKSFQRWLCNSSKQLANARDVRFSKHKIELSGPSSFLVLNAC